MIGSLEEGRWLRGILAGAKGMAEGHGQGMRKKREDLDKKG